MIGLLHGYLLDGSGSNLWTQSVARSLCRIGEDVHLVCQEPHPERFEFVAEAYEYPLGSTEPRELVSRDTPYPGRCVLHRPEIGDTLPVYVTDRYERFSRVVPMVDLPDHEIEAYVARNHAVVEAIVRREGIDALLANHAVLMSVVARRVGASLGVPFGIMPHGSALEYAVKPDPRLRAMAEGAFGDASAVFVIGREMARRLEDVFPDLPLDDRTVGLPLGVDVEVFHALPPERRAEGAADAARALEGVGRGRRPEQGRRMLEALAGLQADGDLLGLWTAASDYEGKLPDAEVERRLEEVDWADDEVVLFVGRLIAAKGIQAVVAALPAVLRERPRARLLVVGHGPLREALESLVWAMERRDAALVRRILAEAGRLGDDEASEGLTTVAAWMDALEARGELEAYLDQAARSRLGERVTFTGYLAHEELRLVFPLADVAVFPSLVREAGPLVFLEALACGVFPLGTYFGGMAASIDEAGEAVPRAVADRMKLRTPDAPEGGMIEDIVDGTVAALAERQAWRGPLREMVSRRHDWRTVARRLTTALAPAAAGD